MRTIQALCFRAFTALCCSGLMLATLEVAPATAAVQTQSQSQSQTQAQSSAQPQAQTSMLTRILWDKASGGSNKTYMLENNIVGATLAANAVNALVAGHGICRYIDVGNLYSNDQWLLVPFRSSVEWVNFIANVKPAEARMDLCRPAFDLNLLQGDGVEFAPALSFNRPLKDERMRGRLDPQNQPTKVKVTPVAPYARIDTRSDAQLTAFRNAAQTRFQAFNLWREDCRDPMLVKYPDGTDVPREANCNPRPWSERIQAVFKYNLSIGANANPAADTEPNATVMPRMISLQRVPAAGTDSAQGIGRWYMDLIPAAYVPPYSPPPILPCGKHKHGEFWWEDQGPQEKLLECPAGFISNPDDPYREQWNLERQYQCFDSKTFLGAYPMAPTRDVPTPHRVVGSCLPIVDGACSPDYNGASFYRITNPAALCIKGDVKKLEQTATGWTWGCEGRNTGTSTTDTACSALLAVDGVCLAHLNYHTTQPATDTQNGCTKGGFAEADDTATLFQWTCGGVSGGKPVTCAAMKDTGWNDGNCAGTASGVIRQADCSTGNVDTQTVACPAGQRLQTRQRHLSQACTTTAHVFNTTVTEARCVADASCPTYHWDEGPWECPGTRVNAQCGSAHGTPAMVAPASNLCSSGTTPGVTDKTDGTGWTWTCVGSGTGRNPDPTCSASKLVLCGSASSSTPVASQPTASLCSSGSATGMTAKSDGTGWTWNCGSNSCAAVKSGTTGKKYWVVTADNTISLLGGAFNMNTATVLATLVDTCAQYEGPFITEYKGVEYTAMAGGGTVIPTQGVTCTTKKRYRINVPWFHVADGTSGYTESVKEIEIDYIYSPADYINPACGTADETYNVTAMPVGAAACRSGTQSDASGGPVSYGWSCTGNYNQVEYCLAHKGPPLPLSQCGAVNLIATSTKPTANLCAQGSILQGTVDEVDVLGGKAFNWSCGKAGSSDWTEWDYCMAPKR